MSEKKIGKLVQVRISDDEHEALTSRVGSRGMQSHVRMLIADFIAGKAGYAYKAENRKWHDCLERVLEEGTERDRIGIEQNLQWAVNNLQSRPTKKAKVS
jgi:hypothetical protein